MKGFSVNKTETGLLFSDEPEWKSRLSICTFTYKVINYFRF